MKIIQSAAFRVDVSAEMGTGHFMRCCTLAQELASAGTGIHFISRYLPDQFSDILIAKGYRYTHLVTEQTPYIAELDHSDWLGVPQAVDAQQTWDALPEKISLLVIDHYAIGSSWEKKLRDKTEHILAIDDLADRDHDCDILLDQNLFKNAEERYAKLVPASCRTLLGPGYALLRNEFALLRSEVIPRSGEVNRILVLMGGTDHYNITGKMLAAINGSGYNKAVDVIIGNQHPQASLVNEQCRNYGYTLYRQPDNIAGLMLHADIAVGSSGSTSWERCCMGLPTLCYTHAENQVPIAKGLEEEGVIIFGGDAMHIEIPRIQQQLLHMINDPHGISVLSRKCIQLVDGMGVKKVHRAITT